ncbi:LysM peptidoglycan-binding domain-containing protein [Peribacillus frigoritolerans]|uniref:LysM peptidoglycan-binding domain-containing protein n=1 Tax=Peribacillus frigoritolerans TaxID=450367 RepID=UPI003CFD621A
MTQWMKLLLLVSQSFAALVIDGVGKYDKAHNEMPGYSWKFRCQYNCREAFDWKDSKTPVKPAPAPDVYTIQEGGTLWSMAHKDGAGGVQVEDLIKANPGIDPAKLKIGQKINFGNAKNVIVQPDIKEVDESSNSGDVTIKSIQNSRYKAGLIVALKPNLHLSKLYKQNLKSSSIKNLLLMVNGELKLRLQLKLYKMVQKAI